MLLLSWLKKQSVDAMLMTGDSYDCGKKMGYMQAFVKYGLRNLKEGPKFRKSIREATEPNRFTELCDNTPEKIAGS
ncbi:UTP--glucose-1-phosphate uridylyltransferase subunit GalF [Citrobacter braakii]|nr:UTP--glucose-1-phosphate uridylyltransferase subunit GalF [Citrobacter braakii]